MTPAERADLLLREMRGEGWEMEFFQTPAGHVHIAAPDSDQPVEEVIGRYVRMICGRQFVVHALSAGALTRQVATFADERLCVNCHRAFLNEEDQALIFEQNTRPARRSGLWAMNRNDAVRAHRRNQEDRRAAAGGR